MKDVHHHIGVVRDDPLARRESVDRHRLDVVVLLQAIVQLSSNGLEMRLRGSRADDKKIGEGRYGAKVENNDVFGLFVRCEFGAGFR